MWFRESRSKHAPRRSRYRRPVERLEDRTVLSASWNNFGGNWRSTPTTLERPAQPIDQLLWQVPLDLDPWGYTHYGDPVFTANNVVIVPIKVTYEGNNQGATNFIEVGLNDVTGAGALEHRARRASITGASDAAPDRHHQPHQRPGHRRRVTIGGVHGNTAANTGSATPTRSAT